jgi:hypothetical protein
VKGNPLRALVVPLDILSAPYRQRICHVHPFLITFRTTFSFAMKNLVSTLVAYVAMDIEQPPF